MKKWADLSAEEIFTFYYEKLKATREGDLVKLNAIKKACPDIFNPQHLIRIEKMIRFAKAFANTSVYQQLQRLKVKRTLSVLK